MHAVTTASKMSRNNVFTWPSPKKAIAKGERDLFHGLPEEFKVTAVTTVMEDAPATW